MFLGLFKGFDLGQFHCDVCELAKHKHVSFPISNTRASMPFTLIHSDVWGPSTVHNIFGAHWFVSFIDNCTRVSWVFLLKQKSNVNFTFQNFFHMVKNQFGVEIKKSGLTMLGIILIKCCHHSSKKKESFMSLYALIHHNKMVWQNGNGWRWRRWKILIL